MYRITVKDFIEATKARFGLVDSGQPLPFGIEEGIRLVSSVDEMVSQIQQLREANDISAAGNLLKVYYTVPKGERWKIMFSYIYATTAATAMDVSHSGRYPVTDGSASEVNCIRYGNSSATARAFDELSGVEIDEGGTIGLRCTGNGADNNVELMLAYKVLKHLRKW